MSFKCAFLGCGPRANGHAMAYELISRGAKVACCDLDRERADSFAATYEIPRVYTDLEEMLDKERPDVVHMVTPPNLRVDLLNQLSAAQVGGVLVEKPICVGADDYARLRELATRTTMKIAVNHQLRHHNRVLELLDEVRQGVYGEIRFLDASAELTMSAQGVHVLDLMFAFNGYEPVQTVFGASSGFDDLGSNHPSPRIAQSLLTFRNGSRGVLQAGQGAPQITPSPTSWQHKRIAVYGTRGFCHWWMYGWEKTLPGGEVERGTLDYPDEDLPGQANLTNAMFDWLEDDAAVCPTNLSTSLDEWEVIMAGYLSTIEARPVDLPCEMPLDLLDRFQRFTEGKGG
jgi:predicted dehydrogenase